ncbi:MAG TPA: hypothetical protein ENJ52_10195 [Aliiroseovarius sp.]|nr:hypothetical protein [Aliiroseovarius sp.]
MGACRFVKQEVPARLILAGACLVLLFWAAVPVRAQSPGAFEFRDTLAAQSTLSIELGRWSDAERATVRLLLKRIGKRAPGLLARALAAGPVSLYRTAEDSPDHPAAAWARRRHEASLIVTDDFFRTGFANGLGVEYRDWLFVHEMAHLADPVGTLGRSADWRAIVGPRIARITQTLAGDGLSLRDAMFQYRDAPARAQGLPSVYAAISLHEALAESAAAVFFAREIAAGFTVPNDVAGFVGARLFAPASEAEARKVRAYRQAALARRNGDLQRAADLLDRVLSEMPGFTMGYYLRGYVRAAQGDLPGAGADWRAARARLPESDARLRAELQAGLDWIAAQ